MSNVHEDYFRLRRAIELADTFERAFRKLQHAVSRDEVDVDHVLRDNNGPLWEALTHDSGIKRPPSPETKQLTRELVRKQWADANNHTHLEGPTET